ncbi:MAG: SDR family NAD(P)-dependent oxidoreductase, partial [Candidatus Puniceispirillum sp.]
MTQTIMITGANRGIGFEMTKQAAAHGNAIIACARNVMEAPALVALARNNPAITLLGLDVTAEGDMKQIAAGMRRKVDLLVCNAGVLDSYGGLDDPARNSRAIETVLMTNIAGVYFTVRAFLPHLLMTAETETSDSDTAKGDAMIGRIAIISSIMGSQTLSAANAPIYRASKAAATNLARSFAVELAPRGIAVGAYHPGWVRTDMGGPNADVAPVDSAAGLLERFDLLSLETTG